MKQKPDEIRALAKELFEAGETQKNKRPRIWGGTRLWSDLSSESMSVWDAIAKFAIKRLTCLIVSAMLLMSAQRASAGYAVCIRIAVATIGAGVYAIQSCNPPWRCWGIPIDEENPSLGMSTNFPSQVLWRVGRENGWFAARNLTYRTKAKAIAAGCTSSNLGPNEVSVEEYLTVEESSFPDGPWTYSRTVLQSPDDIDLFVTNSIPKCFYRVMSTNASPEVQLMGVSSTGTNSAPGAIFRAQFEETTP